MIDLPPGWMRTSVGAIAEVRGGIQKQAKRRPVNNKYPFLRVANVGRGILNLDEIHEIELFDGELERFAIKAGDLLVVEGNGSPGEIGRAAMWRGEILNCVHQNHLICVRPTSALFPKFLELLWSSPEIARQLREVASSTSGLYTLSTSKIKAVKICLPPYEEQRRIVAVLEDHLSRLEVGKASLLAADNRMSRLWQSALNRVVAGEVTASGWADTILVGEVAEVRGGIQKQPKRKPVKNKYPFLRVANVPRGSLDLAEIHEVELFDGELDRYRLRMGDLLVVEGNGSPEQIGRAAMWRDEIADCVHQNHLIRVRPGARFDPCYLELVWNAPMTAEQVRRAASSTSGLHTLSTAKIKSIQIPVPPKQVQEALAAEADRIRSQILITTNTVGRARQRAAVLRRSLLMEAFRGKLVAQDPEDMPASVLLELICAEQATQPQERRRRRTATRAPQEETLL
jgi:type I restriction enzyme S subunit